MRKWLIHTFFRWSAGHSEQKLADLLNRFSLVEADSAWQMMQAMAQVDDPAYRCELFNNALEEVHHAYLFKRSAANYTRRPFADEQNQRKKILEEGKALLDFKVAHYLGEKDVYEQFLSYAQASPKAEIKELFMAIRGDEEEHQRRARIQLLEELGSEAKLRQKIRQVRLKGLYQGWLTLGKTMGNLTFTLVLSLIYLPSGLLLGAWSGARMNDLRLNQRLQQLLTTNR